jgi:hypothetical protein
MHCWRIVDEHPCYAVWRKLAIIKEEGAWWLASSFSHLAAHVGARDQILNVPNFVREMALSMTDFGPFPFQYSNSDAGTWLMTILITRDTQSGEQCSWIHAEELL